jgi:hypothetical protein
MKRLYRGSYIDASCQVWLNLAKQFQRRRFFLTVANQKQELPLVAISSPLKLLGQMEPNLAGSIYVRSSIKLLHIMPFGQQRWLPRAYLVMKMLYRRSSIDASCQA